MPQNGVWEQFTKAAAKGDLIKCKRLFKGRLLIDPFLIRFAVAGGNLDIVDMIIEQGRFCANQGLYGACDSGNIQHFDLMYTTYGARDLERASGVAAQRGHCALLEHICHINSVNLTRAFNNACQYNQHDAARCLIRQYDIYSHIPGYIIDFNKVLQSACQYNNRLVFDFILVSISQLPLPMVELSLDSCICYKRYDMATQLLARGISLNMEGIFNCSIHYKFYKLSCYILTNYDIYVKMRHIPKNLSLYRILVKKKHVQISQRFLSSIREWEDIARIMAMFVVHLDMPRELTRIIRSFMY